VNQPGREEGIVRAGEHPIEHERPEDWGWHGEVGGKARFLTLIPIAFLLLYNFGNHRGHVETIWLIGIAVVMVLVLVWDHFRRKNAWRAK
jgi:hypothetical protein